TSMRKLKTPGGSSAEMPAAKSVSSSNIGSLRSSARTAKANSLLADGETAAKLTALKVTSIEEISFVSPFRRGTATVVSPPGGAAGGVSGGGASGAGALG